MPRRKDPHIPDAVLDQLLAGADPKTVFDPNELCQHRREIASAGRSKNTSWEGWPCSGHWPPNSAFQFDR